MADSKITALTALTAADPVNDMFPVVDVSDTSMAASGTTKRISANNILSSSPTASGALTVTGLVTAGSATITGAATVGTTLGVTGVSTFAAGTALLPALTTTGDTNTGIYYPAADTFAVTTAGVERYRVDSAGNFAVGIAPSAGGTAFYKSLELGKAGCGLFVATAGLTGSELTYLSGNAVLTYSAGPLWSYGNNGSAAALAIEDGLFVFKQVGSGTAGNPITWTDSMILDGSGNLLVASGVVRAGGRTQILGGSIADINISGNNVGIAFGGAASILPCDGSSATTDGVANFGSASKRWNTIFAATGTINTSDQNDKQDIADLGDAEKRVAGKIKSLVKKYRFKDAVASKGKNARIHVGWIAQDIQNAFLSEGLDASKYGVFCSDTWEENGVEKTRLGLRHDELLAFVVSNL